MRILFLMIKFKYIWKGNSIIEDINTENSQITLLQSEELSVVCLYRSDADRNLNVELSKIIPTEGPCLVIGDFNLCHKKSKNHEVFTALKSMGFNNCINEATHIAGGYIDQAWLRSTKPNNVQPYSPYYTCKDHDAILITIYDPSTGKN